MFKQLLFITGLLITMINFGQTNYRMDKNHSRLAFTATHFGISKVDGNFKNFDATLNSSKEDFTDAVIQMTAEARSINTDVEKRDDDLKSANWLDVEKFPVIEFKSNSFKKVSGKNYKLAGIITIHGVSKTIVFDVVYNGKALNPSTNKNSVGFTVNGTLNRRDFNVGTDAFDKVVGKEVELRSNIEFIME